MHEFVYLIIFIKIEFWREVGIKNVSKKFMSKLKKVSSSGPPKLPGGKLVTIIAGGEGVRSSMSQNVSS